MFYKIHNDQTGIYTGKIWSSWVELAVMLITICSHWLLQILLFSKNKERLEDSAKWDS